MNAKIYLVFFLAVFTAAGCKTKDKETSQSSGTGDNTLQYDVLNVLPHNPEAWTQGLVIHDNKILESTGRGGTSWIAEVNPGSGEHDKKVNLERHYFGEGITVLNNKIYYLTWQSKKGFIYEVDRYRQLGEFPVNTQKGEGWGITHDGNHLILSDGTSQLYYVDTASFQVVRTLPVMAGNTRVKNLNELEYIDGYIYANVWESSYILKIDPSSGKVAGRIDLSPITNEIRRTYPDADVLNGIAYDKNSNAILVTGKLWPRSYLLRLR